MAMDNALSHAELQHEQDRLKLLLELTNRVVSNLELRKVLNRSTLQFRMKKLGIARPGT